MNEAKADSPFKTAILQLLRNRGKDASICPSEAARLVSPVDWRPLMDPVRQSARQLQREGLVEICQRGKPLDLGSELRGPVRIRLKDSATPS